ncbi:hypothetical protein FPOAC2_07206 [Fusarium poae]|jgi:hypothetical protein
MDVPTDPDWGMDAPDFFDEDSIYNEEDPEDPSLRNTRKAVLRPLAAVSRDGAVRTIFEGNPDESFGLVNETSDYTVTVDRLAWIDGWRITTGDGTAKTQENPMSLVVFNIKFFDKRPDSSRGIGGAIAELRFFAEHTKGEHPEVVAWGPFRHQERWNFSTGYVKVATKADLQASAGFAGPQLSGTLGREKELSRTIVAFDEGFSTHLYPQGSKTIEGQKKKPNGVQWFVKQNHLHEQGVESEMRIAALISRPEQMQTYRVSFRLQAHTGAKETARNAVQRLSRQPIGDQINWRTEPNLDKMRRCFAEGFSIAEAIDSNNLGELIKNPNDSQNLDQEWLKPQSRSELSQALQAETRTEPEEGSGTSDVQASVDVPGIAGASINFQQPIIKGNESQRPKESYVTGDAPTEQGSQTSANKRHGKQDAADFTRSPPNQGYDASQRLKYGEHDRMVSLEIRAAQAETRLGIQERLNIELQERVMRLEKALSNVKYSA